MCIQWGFWKIRLVKYSKEQILSNCQMVCYSSHDLNNGLLSPVQILGCVTDDLNQWGSEYRTSPVFKWLKVVQSSNGLSTKWSSPLTRCHLVNRLLARHFWSLLMNGSVNWMSCIQIPAVKYFLYVIQITIWKLDLLSAIWTVRSILNYKTSIEKVPLFRCLGFRFPLYIKCQWQFYYLNTKQAQWGSEIRKHFKSRLFEGRISNRWALAMAIA